MSTDLELTPAATADSRQALDMLLSMAAPEALMPPAEETSPVSPVAPVAPVAPVSPVAGAGADGEAAPADQPAGAARDRRLTVPALLVILVIQAFLSLRLVRTNTAFQDEALYLWAGHLELAHWLHGSPVPSFAAYFSGAPVIYPPLGALADGIGGLVLARCLSLAFMLAATALLHGFTRRIFGRPAALFAAALFAGTASVQFLGAFATYDAMALFLLALATWLGIASRGQPPRRAIAMLAAASATLALGNATKYASALFDPAVLATVLLSAWQLGGKKAGLRAAGVMTSVLGLTLAAAVAAGGRAYWHGIEFSTVARASGAAQRADIIYLSGVWVGIVVGLAVIGAVLVALTLRNRALTALAWVLALSSMLAPAEQARIETLTSLFKHVGYGALFGSVIAGAALASFPLAVPRARARRAINLGIALVIAAGIGGAAVAGTHYAGWPDSRRVTAILDRQLSPNGEYLAEDDDALAYYLANQVSWQQWTSTWSFRYTDPWTGEALTGGPAYAAAIRARHFSVIILSFGDTLAIDQQIQRDIGHYGGYRLAASIPYATTSFAGDYKIWVLAGRPGR